jgi:hypothetical protein
MYRTILDLSTGEEIQVPLTQEEIEVLQNNSQPPAPIRTIDARRLRLALLQLNLLDKVEAGLSKLGQAAQIDWEYATDIKEDYPLVISLSTELGLNVNKIFDVAIEII